MSAMRNRPPQAAAACGFSLLEIILALAILGGALAVLGSIVQVGTRTAKQARGRVAAELQCQSILTEIVAGLRPAEPVQSSLVDFPDPEYIFLYSVEVQPADMEGMLVVRVSVFEDRPPEQNPIRVSLVRWMIDPEVEAEAEAADEQAAAQTGDTADSGTLDSGNGGGASTSGGATGGGGSGAPGGGGSGR